MTAVHCIVQFLHDIVAKLGNPCDVQLYIVLVRTYDESTTIAEVLTPEDSSCELPVLYSAYDSAVVLLITKDRLLLSISDEFSTVCC